MSRHEIRVLLVGVGREVHEALAAPSASDEPRLRLQAAASLADALPHLRAEEVDAIVCDLAAFARWREALVGGSWGMRPVSTVVLVPPGAEERAGVLLEHESAEFVLQAGNYPQLLPALLRRSLHRQEVSWAGVARVIRHEINNPLTGILGNAELILAEDGLRPEKVRQRVTTVINLAVRLRDVVRKLEEHLRREGSLLQETLPPDPPTPWPLPPEVLR